MKILFINRHAGSGTLPLASFCLSSTLEARYGEDVDCPVLDLPPGFDGGDALRTVVEADPDVVVLTLYSWSRDDLASLAGGIPSAFDEEMRPVVLAGGPETGTDPASVQALPGVDWAAAGEGEEILSTLIGILLEAEGPRSSYRAILSRELPGPVLAPPVEDLDALPSPLEAAAAAGRTYADTVWEITRGCPFGCHFCFESKGSGRLRSKSFDTVSADLDRLLEGGAYDVFVLDPTFNADPPRAKELLRLFAEKAPDLRYHIEVRAEFLDVETAELFAGLDCIVQLGLQTSDPEVARRIGRPFSPERFREKLLLLHEEGVPYGLDLICGLPGDTLQGFLGSVDFALECAPNHLDVFPLAVLPGTRLRDDVEEGVHRLVCASEPPYLVSETDGFPVGDMRRAADIADAVVGLYNGGRAVPWFLTAAELFDMRPSGLLEAWAGMERAEARAIGDALPAVEASDGESARPDRLRRFLLSLAGDTDNPSVAALGDAVAYLTAESAVREGREIPGELAFEFDPRILGDHLDMGVVDPEELAFFVPRAPGLYCLDPRSGSPGFVRMD